VDAALRRIDPSHRQPRHAERAEAEQCQRQPLPPPVEPQQQHDPEQREADRQRNRRVDAIKRGIGQDCQRNDMPADQRQHREAGKPRQPAHGAPDRAGNFGRRKRLLVLRDIVIEHRLDPSALARRKAVQ
jgi:hypothetical protein